MLDFWDIFFIAIILVGLIVLVFIVVNKMIFVKSYNIIQETIVSSENLTEIAVLDLGDLFHFSYSKNGIRTIVKVIHSKEDYEFIITNSNKWTINTDPKKWTRKTKPVFIESAEDFIKYKSDEPLRKIVVIYPDCRRIIRYLNESDTVIVKQNDNTNGVHFVKFSELKEFLEK